MNLDSLPDSTLFEILVRFSVKTATRCKCVSKRWFALISHHAFLSRYLHLQYDKRNPLMLMEPTLIFLNQNGFFTNSINLPEFENGKFSLDFLPGYQHAHKKRSELDLPLVATCNDLVLWCPSKILQRDYYICNPYTKQWIALPPPPQCNFGARVGFICEPYYYYNEEVGHDEQCDKDGHFNVDYRYAIVRILSPLWLEKPGLHLEIFSSETGEWREYVFSCPQHFKFSYLRYEYTGLAYKGKLYWTEDHHYTFMISLDPFSNYVQKKGQDPLLENYINKFDVVEFPDQVCGVVSASQGGRLRLFTTWLHGIHVWELKDDDDNGDKVEGGVGKWCKIVEFRVNQMVSNDPLITQRIRSEDHSACEVASDPSNDDIWYVRSHINYDDNIILMCNIRKNTIEKVTIDKYSNCDSMCVFTYMVPWWPTPVPKIDYNHKDEHEVHRTKCILCSNTNCTEALILNEQRLLLRYIYLLD